MTDTREITRSAEEMRTIAEIKVASQQAASDVSSGELSAKRLLHELQVHQVELEMQNEELRLANQTLKEYELHMHNVIKMTPAGYFRLDTNDCFVDINDAWLKMHGYESRQEIIGKHFSLLQVDSSSDLAMKHLAELHRGMPIPLGDFTSRHKDGSVGHHIFSAHPVQESGRLVGFEWFIIDITERKRAESILADREQFLNAIIESEPECIKMIDSENKLIMMNPAGLEMIEADSFEQVKGLNLSTLVTETYRSKFIELTKQVFEGIPGVLEFENIGLNGRHLWLETHATPFRNSQGEVTALLGITRNVTERKQAEEAKILLERQFQESQKLESLGTLAGGIAHDFNNILAIIMGYCGLTKMDYDTAEKNLPHIENAVERAAALCRQMLAYAGKAELAISQVNMRMVVDEMVTMLKATLPQNAEINLDVPTEIPSINGDAGQIRQIIMNLVINASEAVGKEQGKIRVSLATTTVIAGQSDRDYKGKLFSPGEYVCLEVTDNGCGMNEETKRRIFEPFYTTKFTGRGLGMSAVLGIINSHDGALQFQSQLGQGSTFRVYLPVQKRVSVRDENIRVAVPATPWRGSGTILLVEDEDRVRLVAKALLENIGFTVLEAVNGKEALELYQRNATDIALVMTDMGMPVMDVYELFSDLKKLNPALPIIISSGYGDAEVSSRIGIDNIAGLVSKPYGTDQLREVLNKALEDS